MDNTTYIALSRADTLTRALEVTANNLANANTNGFKASNQLFSDYLVRQHHDKATGAENAQQFSQDRATYQDHQQGALKQTGNLTDFAINGEGFFSVRTTDGIRLTRNGEFHLRSDGTLIDGSDNPVMDVDKKNIVIPRTDKVVSVASDGTISTETGQIAQISVVNVKNLNMLHQEGSYLLKPADGVKPTEISKKEIRQGMLEASNVNPVTETTKLVATQRDYDIIFQLIQAEATRHNNAIDKITQEAAS